MTAIENKPDVVDHTQTHGDDDFPRLDTPANADDPVAGRGAHEATLLHHRLARLAARRQPPPKQECRGCITRIRAGV